MIQYQINRYQRQLSLGKVMTSSPSTAAQLTSYHSNLGVRLQQTTSQLEDFQVSIPIPIATAIPGGPTGGITAEATTTNGITGISIPAQALGLTTDTPGFSTTE